MSSLGPKGKDLSVFVRFGGLNLKRQRGYSLWPEGPCSPPARRGIYAAPKIAFDRWLIGSLAETQPSIFPKTVPVSESDFDTETEHLAVERLQIKHLLSLIRHEFRKVHGTVWSQLGGVVRRPEIINTHGAWVKTTMREWRRAFAKASLRARLPDAGGLEHERVNTVNSAKGIGQDYLGLRAQVFFDEDV